MATTDLDVEAALHAVDVSVSMNRRDDGNTAAEVVVAGSADKEKDNPPQLPQNWDRCHAYNERKRRFCRQIPAANQNFCGNHLHCLEEESRSSNKKKKDRGARIPCPIDPSHLIFESALEKHVLICPAAKQKEETRLKQYYREGTNTGGFGELGDNKIEMDLCRSKMLAMAVMKVFCTIFPSAVLSPTKKSDDDNVNLSDKVLKSVTEKDIYNALPEVDLSHAEDGLANDISKHKINVGGPRHLHQIASILGHVRQKSVIEATVQDREYNVIEMGAGRGMLGLVIASALGAAQTENASSKVKLYLVERSGTRYKAETKIRTVGDTTQNSDDNLRLDRIEFKRIKCDLAHVHMSTALPFLATTKSEMSRTIVVAKHLCGAGTDLAIKSLREIAQCGNVDCCIMATCCHGLCTWSDYVGRDCFLELFRDVGGLATFGARDFDQLKRWTSASVLENNPIAKEQQANNEHKPIKSYLPQNIFLAVQELGLVCGVRGLGRACQRLIDYGRTDYIKRHLFQTKSSSEQSHYKSDDISLCHYVSSEITPQNTLIVAVRSLA